MKGFTLMELLVVVLVIGILSAVALPQYEMVVMKTRFSSMRPIAEALADAQEIFYMANGRYATQFDELDLTPPMGGTLSNNEDGGQTVSYPNFVCRIQHGSGDVVYCSGANTGYYRIQLSPADTRKRLCYVSSSDVKKELKKKMCQSFGGELIEGSTWIRYKLP